MYDVPEMRREYDVIVKLKGEEKLGQLRSLRLKLCEFERAAAKDWEIARDHVLSAGELGFKVTRNIKTLEAAASRRK